MTTQKSKKNVVVQAGVGKEFPDMRQNEREIKFIRMGDAVRTVGWPKGEWTLNRSLVYFYSQGTRNRIGVLQGEGETGYTAQEDMKSINSYNINYITTLL